MTATVLVHRDALAGERLEIAGEAYRHLFRARRLQVGDELQLVDGEGRARRGRVEAIDTRSAAVALGETLPNRDPRPSVELLLAPIRLERAGWAVEKCTELGVAAVRFVATARAPRRYGAGSLERLRRVARAALEQSGGARLPAITGVHRWEELPELIGGRDAIFFDPGSPPFASPPSAGAVVLIGPEGGWEDGERQQLISWGAHGAALGVRTLRSETAAVVASSWLLAGFAEAR